MKVPLKWLRDYVDVEIEPAKLAEKITEAGLEVSEVKVIGGHWDKVVVGKITAIEPHPNADRLRLATVDLGVSKETVVCGAPNLFVDNKIAFATTGAMLLDGHTGKLAELKPAKIRGVASSGMICSEKELGISENHEGILVLPEDYVVGKPLADYLSDVIFDLEITPNRADVLSIMGVAREVSALTGKKFNLPGLGYPESEKKVGDYISVEIKDADLCPRYCATVIEDIKIGPSPIWMQDRLTACGMRPINNVVDITNYVMLEFGQPLHAFDYNRIRGKKIIVRRAYEGESMYSLDEVERKFSSDNLLIADAEGAVAVAGIMGGLISEVTDNTNCLLIESANFNQATIHNGSLSLKLRSEASLRFERGLNENLAPMALKRATQLMAQYCEGKVVSGMIDEYPGKKEKNPITICSADVLRLLGVKMSELQVRTCLELLGLVCLDNEKKQKIDVEIPWWRNDLSCTADLVEEVARVTGYENIPETILSSSLPKGEGSPWIPFRYKLRNSMVSCGFQEIITYTLTSQEVLKKLSPQGELIGPEPLRMAYPMSRELEFLRTSLRAGVLATFARNQRNRSEQIRLFEVGKIFISRKNDLPQENEMLCGLIDSIMAAEYWKGKNTPIDFYTAKGVVERILSVFHVKAEFIKTEDKTLTPGKSAAIIAGNVQLGVVGEIHPQVLTNFDILDKAYIFELELDKLMSVATNQPVYQQIMKLPAINRDVALLVDSNVAYDRIAGVFSEFPLIQEVRLFDLYSGEQVPSGKKSMAFRITYRSTDHTLTDGEIDSLQNKILDKLASEVGASLRS